jgi:hypothetical protein
LKTCILIYYDRLHISRMKLVETDENPDVTSLLTPT